MKIETFLLTNEGRAKRAIIVRRRYPKWPFNVSTIYTISYSSSVGKLDQAGSPASACTGLYRQKGKINPGDTGSQPKLLHIRADI
jgi:hypothetical protein